MMLGGVPDSCCVVVSCSPGRCALQNVALSCALIKIYWLFLSFFLLCFLAANLGRCSRMRYSLQVRRRGGAIACASDAISSPVKQNLRTQGYRLDSLGRKLY